MANWWAYSMVLWQHPRSKSRTPSPKWAFHKFLQPYIHSNLSHSICWTWRCLLVGMATLQCHLPFLKSHPTLTTFKNHRSSREGGTCYVQFPLKLASQFIPLASTSSSAASVENENEKPPAIQLEFIGVRTQCMHFNINAWNCVYFIDLFMYLSSPRMDQMVNLRWRRLLP